MSGKTGLYLHILFISMLPVLELRGAIPVALSQGVEPWLAYLLCVAGNLLPVPFIIFFIRPLFKRLRQLHQLQSLIKRLEERAFKKSEMVLRYNFWGLALFVAIPLPGTGAWTGALIAALLDMRFKRAFPAILLGVLLAGVLVTLITTGALSIFS